MPTDFQTPTSSLPENIKSLINSPEFFQSIEDIGAKFKLHIDQTGDLSSEIITLITGATPSNKFQKNIANRLGIDDAVARDITHEVNEGIIKNIKHILVQRAEELEVERSKNTENDIFSGGVLALNPNDSYREMSRSDLLSEIENPISSSEHRRIVKRKLSPDTPENTAAEIIEEALVEAAAHNFKGKEIVKENAGNITDLKHRIPSHENNIFFLPQDHTTIKPEDVFEEGELEVNKTTPAVEQKEVGGANQPVRPITKKRPLADIIPQNIPRKYNIDPYRELVE